MTQPRRLGLFEGYGVEMEYMIVDRDTLEVKPISDEILKAEAGELTSDLERGKMAWSNELVLHVLELKTNGPALTLPELAEQFHKEVLRVNELLVPFNAMLLPTGAHPFMDPFKETKLWPHEASEIYEAYNRIFNCQGHGWSNLRSTHLEPAFRFRRGVWEIACGHQVDSTAHTSYKCRLTVAGWKVSGLPDTRLEVYRKNQQKIPLIAGQVVPEAVFSESEYDAQIFQPMFQAIAPYDPQGDLQEEFLNSRGAIARFSRSAIEIRIIDNQECPLADIAIVTFVSEVLKKLVAQQWSSYEAQQKPETGMLASVSLTSLKNGAKTEIQNRAYLELLGIQQERATIQEVWDNLWAQVQNEEVFTPALSQAVEVILRKGNLSERILKFLGSNPSLEEIRNVYINLSTCLSENKLYQP